MSLIHWLPLTNEIKDIVGGASIQAAPNRTLPTSGASGKLGLGYTFNDSGVQVNNIQLTGTMSFALWIKLSTHTNCHILDLRKVPDTTTETGYQPLYYNTSSGIQIYGTAGGSKYIPCNLSTDWHHLTVTLENNQATLYLDGIEKGQASLTGLEKVVHATIGCRATGTNPCPGIIQDVRIYNHALSKAEVKELARAKLIHYTFDDELIESTTNIDPCKNSMAEKALYNFFAGPATTTFGSYFGFDCFKIYLKKDNITSWTGCYLNANPITQGATVGQTVTRSCWMYVPSGQTKPDHFTESIEGASTEQSYVQYDFNKCDTWQRISLTGTTSNTSTNNYLHYFMAMSSGSVDFTFYIRDFQMEVNSRPTFYTPATRKGVLTNEAGFSLGETTYNLALSTNARIGQYSAYFNGLNSYIDIPFIKSDQFSTDYTLSFWVNPLDNGRAVYFGDYGTANCSNINFERQSGGGFRYYHNASPDWKPGVATTPPGEWTMLTITYSATASVLTVYKNGSPEGGLSHTATLVKNTGSIMRIGRDNRSVTNATAADSTPLYGYIDDFRFYATCLSSTDVKDLYESAAKIAKSGEVITTNLKEDSAINITKKHSVEAKNIVETDMPEYILLDFVYSSGNQYIDTGYYWKSEKATIIADLNYSTPTASSTLFGSEEYYSSSGRYFAHILHAPSANGNFLHYIGANKFGTAMPLPIGNRTLIEYISHGNNTFTSKMTPLGGTTDIINDKVAYSGTILTRQNSTQTAENRGNIYIFSNHNAQSGTNGIQCPATMALYRFTMYDNDVMVRDFLPCKQKQSDGTWLAGLFDLVEGKFYSSPVDSLKAGTEINTDTLFFKNGTLRTKRFIEI